MRSVALIITLLLLFSFSYGQTGPVVASTARRADTFKITNIALVIGTDNYEVNTEWPTLTNPCFDAKSISDKLTFDYGYNVKLLKNPPKDTILKSIAELKEKIKTTGGSKYVNLVVFVAGYGGWDNGKAYIVPTNAKKKADDKGRASCLPLIEFRQMIEAIGAPHTLVLIDACFGGSFDKTIKETDTVAKNEMVYDQAAYINLLNEKMPIVSAKYITSGGKEYVEDARPGHHSPLAAVIMKELDDCYENAQPLSFSRLVSAVKSIKPTPRAGDFGASQPNSDFLLIPNSVAKGNGKKPKYNNPQQKTVITKNAPASEAADPYADLNDDKPHIPSVEELKPPMAFLKGGSFTMGAYRSDYHDEEPLHMVKLSGFYMSKYEVTQKLWTDVMGLNPSLHTGCPDCPVENISFQDIQKFIYKLNKRTKKNYRLPTEAEWEYAANCGNMDMAYEFSGSERIDWVGWYKTNSGGTTHSVGQKMANSLGIFDLTGNVAEWCQDTYASYAADTLVNPVATSGGNRVVRGGDYTSPVFKCRNAYRSDRIPNTKDGTVGFRLVLSGDIDPDAPVIPGN